MNAERSRAFVTSVVLAMPVADMMRSMGLRQGATGCHEFGDLFG